MSDLILLLIAAAILVWFFGGWNRRWYSYDSPGPLAGLAAVLVAIFVLWIVITYVL